MTDAPPPDHGPAPAPPSAPPPPQPPRWSASEWWASLRRRTDTRLVGGVCAGLAASLGVPRVLVIIGFALATIPFVGLPVYVLLWVLLPDDQGRRVADNSKWRDLLVAGVLCCTVFLIVGWSSELLNFAMIGRLLPWTLILIGIAVVLRRNDPTSSTPIPPAPTVREAWMTPPPPPPPDAPQTETVFIGPLVQDGDPTDEPITDDSDDADSADSTDSTDGPTAATAATAVFAGAAPPPPPFAVPTQGPATTQIPSATPAPAPRPPRPSFRFPVVGLLTWVTVIIVGGFLALAAVANPESFGPGTILAIVTIVFGAGLLFSAFVGRARGLILPALACSLAVLGLGVLNLRADNFLADRDVTIVSAADLDQTITAGYGSSTIDLGALRLDRDASLTFTQTAGTLWVKLPTEVTTRITYDLDVGEVNDYGLIPTEADYTAWSTTAVPDEDALVPADRYAGVDPWSSQTISGSAPDSPYRVDRGSTATLDLDLTLHIGEIRIVHPEWAYLPSDLQPAGQACIDQSADAEPMSVLCSDITSVESRVPACLDINGWMVDCTTEEPGTRSFPRVPGCIDVYGTDRACLELGIAVTNVERYPNDPTYEGGPAAPPDLTTPPDPSTPSEGAN